MKRLVLLGLCLVLFLYISPVLAQSAPASVITPLKNAAPFQIESAMPPIVMDVFTVNQERSSKNQEKLDIEVERLLARPSRDAGFITAAPENIPLVRERDDMPFFGTFVGRGNELRALRGGVDVKFFGNTTTTLYFRSGIRWNVGTDKYTKMVFRVRRGPSLAVERTFRDERDILKPIKDFLVRHVP